MNKNKIDVLFAVIALREVTFFSKIADVLKQKYNLTSAFLTFYQPGDRYLKKNGHRVFSLHKEANFADIEITDDCISEIESKYSIKNIRKLLLHEKLTFGRFEEDKLLAKLVKYDRYFNTLLSQYKIDNVVQELGGFIAPMSLYYNCIFHDVRHIFIEPAMFKGRLFFNIDSTEVDLKEPVNVESQAIVDVKRYVDSYRRDKTVVIPDKDRHHFKNACIGKLLNRRNVIRLIEKLYFKYGRKEKQEYDAILNHIKRHVTMMIRGQFLKRYYKQPDYAQKYVYFPLHVPLDFQLTVRESRYLNQLALIERIEIVLPAGCQLYIKEHPASIGGYEYRMLRKILRNRNIKLIHPNVNSYNLISNALGVITINSKVGAEALMQGRRVIVLGSPYYAAMKGASTLQNIEELPEALFCHENDTHKPDYDFLSMVYCNSFKGELYNEEQVNISDFAFSLKTHLSNTDTKSTF
jgi:hypothetical protein